MGTFIDIESWKRREHYRFFKNFHHPFFSLCTAVEVSTLVQLSKAPGGPAFSLAALFLSLHAANEVEAFRLRLRAEGVWLHDEVHAGSTVLLENETFTFAYFPFTRDFTQFQTRGQAEIRARKASPTLAGGTGEDDLLHYSMLPWIRFSGFTNALRLGEDSIPKIVFGQYYWEAGTWRLPLSVEVHHALVDGRSLSPTFWSASRKNSTILSLGFKGSWSKVAFSRHRGVDHSTILIIKNKRNVMARSLYARLARSQKRRSYSRRDFLKLTLAASAGVLASCAMPPQALMGGRADGKEVIVIGAGFSGLACAYELHRAHYQVTVIEARKRPGGRVVTYTDFPHGKQVEGGGEFIGANHPTWLAYAHHFGLSLREITPAEDLNSPVILGGQRLTDTEVEALYEEMTAAYARLNIEAAPIDADQPWTCPQARQLDRRNTASWIRTLDVSARAKAAIATDLAAENGVDPHFQSYLGLLTMIKGGGLAAYWTESEAYRCIGGNQQLAAQLVRGIGPHRLRFGDPVTAIRIREAHVEVTLANGEILAGEEVVLTVPPSVWHRINFTPPLPPGLTPQMGAVVKYLVTVKTRFWRADQQAPYAFTDGLCNHIWEATDGQPGDPAVLTAFSGGSTAHRARRQWRQQREAAFHAELARLYPRFPQNVLAGRFVDWPADPWTGAGYAFPAPGQVTTLGPLWRTGLGRLHFAGEHTSYKFIGYMEGALDSGVSLAKRLIQRDQANNTGKRVAS